MKKILLVIDFQNDFVDGALGFAGAEKLDEKICRKINEYRENGDEVVFTKDTHFKNYLSTQEGKNLPIPHCIKGTKGWEIYGRCGKCVNDGDKIIEKGGFGSLELIEYLSRKEGIDAVEIVGLVSNICVLANAVGAKTALPEAEIIVDASCTTCADEKLNNEALDCMEGVQIKVINRV